MCTTSAPTRTSSARGSSDWPMHSLCSGRLIMSWAGGLSGGLASGAMTYPLDIKFDHLKIQVWRYKKHRVTESKH